MIVYSHGPRINNETGMTVRPRFYFRGKKRKYHKKEKRAR